MLFNELQSLCEITTIPCKGNTFCCTIQLRHNTFYPSSPVAQECISISLYCSPLHGNLVLLHGTYDFHWIGSLGRFSLQVLMSSVVCCCAIACNFFSKGLLLSVFNHFQPFCIGATIRKRQEIPCLLYMGFLQWPCAWNVRPWCCSPLFPDDPFNSERIGENI